MRHHVSSAILSIVMLNGCVVPQDTSGKPSGRISLLGTMNRPSTRSESLPSAFRESRELTHIEGNTWRTPVPASAAFQLVSRILSQSYIISHADRRELTIATDWDKFFVNGRLFRNRLSVTIFPVSAKSTEIVLKNSVEYYSGTQGKSDDLREANWLPTPDVTDEVPRIVENLSQQSSAWAKNQTQRAR